jgi:hypothetical protein
MTCGSHLAAAVSTFERRQGIERKRQVTKYEVPKIIKEKKVFNVSKAAGDQKKKEVARN